MKGVIDEGGINIVAIMIDITIIMIIFIIDMIMTMIMIMSRPQLAGKRVDCCLGTSTAGQTPDKDCFR